MLDVILAIVWIVLLVTYIVVTLALHRNEKKLKEAVSEMHNTLIEQNIAIREQNTELVKANQNLNRVIISVCSKSVRDRKEERGDKDEANV